MAMGVNMMELSVMGSSKLTRLLPHRLSYFVCAHIYFD
jgi:hypothetical protein